MAEPALQWPPHHRAEWTEADLAGMPDDGNTYEILDGKLNVTPPPTETHQAQELAIAFTLRGAAPAGWLVRTRIGVRLPNGYVEPDVAVLRPATPRGLVWHDAAHVGLVVEVASRSTRNYDAGEKAHAYADAGIPWYWRVSSGPHAGIHIYALTGIGEYSHHATVTAGETLTVTEPFEITIQADELLNPTR